MLNTQRRYNLGIWALGFGYYLFYTPYSGFTKALSAGLFPGMRGPLRGPVLLPVSVIATATCMLGFITVMGWWKYAGRREFFGISIPFPRLLTFLSGICMAIIIGTTTLAFSFGGLSIVLVLVMLRAGTLMIAPVVDRIAGRRVRWFSWTAMFISLLGLSLALSDVAHYQLTLAAIIDIAVYLAAYFFKLQFMSRLAKSNEKSATRRYFVEEQMVASPLLLLALGVMAIVGAGDVMMDFRIGLTTFLTSQIAVYAALAGVFYAGLCICTTLIFLDRRENTFCVPMHCGSSMLSGFTASAVLAYFFNQNPTSPAQTISSVFIVIALGFLSPLHHFERTMARLKDAFARLSSRFAGLAPRPSQSATLFEPAAAAKMERAVSGVPDQGYLTSLPRLILFVCSGNTCRSPIAAAVGKAEIATRLRIPFEEMDSSPVKAISAGVSAKVGAPMTDEAKAALRQLGFHPNGHRARSVTPEIANRAEKIFCMTEAHRADLLKLVPAAAGKTQCLDPSGDIADPIGGGMETYVVCAQRIHRLVRARFDEIGLTVAEQL